MCIICIYTESKGTRLCSNVNNNAHNSIACFRLQSGIIVKKIVTIQERVGSAEWERIDIRNKGVSEREGGDRYTHTHRKIDREREEE